MAESFSPEIVESLVREHVCSNSIVLNIEKVTTGEFNTTYTVDGTDRPIVIRISPPDDAGFVFYEKGMMAQEPGIHRVLRSRTSVPVPEILVYDSSRRLIDRDYLIMERLPGRPLTYFSGTREQHNSILKQTGTYLRMIHNITADSYGYLGEHKCMQPQSDWASAFRIMWNLMIDDISGTGYYDADEQSHVRGLLERHYRHFDRQVTSHLLHMDIWSQNVLVDEQANVIGIIDFDRALWGDTEIEFAVLDYCGMSEPSFWDGYGMSRDTSESAQIRRIFYLLYEIQKYIVIYHYRGSDPADPLKYKQKVMKILSTL